MMLDFKDSDAFITFFERSGSMALVIICVLWILHFCLKQSVMVLNWAFDPDHGRITRFFDTQTAFISRVDERSQESVQHDARNAERVLQISQSLTAQELHLKRLGTGMDDVQSALIMMCDIVTRTAKTHGQIDISDDMASVKDKLKGNISKR